LEVFGLRQDLSAAHTITELSEQEKEILDFLQDPCSRDELIESFGMPAHEINSLISAMEIKGLIKEELGEIRRV
jgi:predicted Rossmann fold nucleotide-binding protein DprA/Smf involved in DNA uptake